MVLGDGRTLTAAHKGQAAIQPKVKLANVLYVPGLKENLFSVSVASAKAGVKVVLENDTCKVRSKEKVAMTAGKHGGMFRITAATATEERKGAIVDYHRRCGHTNYKTIAAMIKMGILPPTRNQENGKDEHSNQ